MCSAVIYRDDKYTIKREAEVHGLQVQWHQPHSIIGTVKDRIVVSHDAGNTWKLAASLHLSVRKILLRLLNLQRTRYLSTKYLRPIKKDGHCTLILVVGKSVLLAQPDGSVRHIWEQDNGFGGALRAGICYQRPWLYIGEYWANKKRRSVRLIRCNVHNCRTEVVWRFPAGQIRHIHGVHNDPYDGSIWLTTGDTDSEVHFLRFGGSGSPTLVGSGGQEWRAIDLCFTEDSVIFGTDIPAGPNYLFALSRRTGRRSMLGSVDNPIYYIAPLGRCYIFSTAAETYGSPKQRQVATLGMLTEDFNIQTLASLRKDLFPTLGFGYGRFEFSKTGNHDPSTIWVAAKGVEGGFRSWQLSYAHNS